MHTTQQVSYTAFEGFRRIATSDLHSVALRMKEIADRGSDRPLLLFNDVSGQQIELDLRGSVQDAIRGTEDYASTFEAAEASTPRGPGRPKLGVVAREVTLLPRHWDWLSTQPGGASVALRKLVEAARRDNQGKDRLRQAKEAAYGFIAALAGNLPGFEEATRALFNGNASRFHEMTEGWPDDVRDHGRKLAAVAFENGEAVS